MASLVSAREGGGGGDLTAFTALNAIGIPVYGAVYWGRKRVSGSAVLSDAFRVAGGRGQLALIRSPLTDRGGPGPLPH